MHVCCMYLYYISMNRTTSENASTQTTVDMTGAMTKKNIPSKPHNFRCCYCCVFVRCRSIRLSSCQKTEMLKLNLNNRSLDFSAGAVTIGRWESRPCVFFFTPSPYPVSPCVFVFMCVFLVYIKSLDSTAGRCERLLSYCK